jgi:hypothetical protein
MTAKAIKRGVLHFVEWCFLFSVTGSLCVAGFAYTTGLVSFPGLN